MAVTSSTCRAAPPATRAVRAPRRAATSQGRADPQKDATNLDSGYQQYMNQYAGGHGSAASEGQKGGYGRQYMHQYADQYMSKYAPAYQKYYQQYAGGKHQGAAEAEEEKVEPKEEDEHKEAAHEEKAAEHKADAAHEEDAPKAETAKDAAEPALLAESAPAAAVAPLVLASAANATELKQEAEDAVHRMDALEQALKRSERDHGALQRAAAADANALVDRQRTALRSVLSDFRNCSGTPKACEEKAREAIEQLRRRGEQSLHDEEKAARGAARQAAKKGQAAIRTMAEDVRRRTDALARADGGSREAAGLASRLNRRAQDTASRAERHIEKLARMREDVFRHHCERAEERLKHEVRMPEALTSEQPSKPAADVEGDAAAAPSLLLARTPGKEQPAAQQEQPAAKPEEKVEHKQDAAHKEEAEHKADAVHKEVAHKARKNVTRLREEAEAAVQHLEAVEQDLKREAAGEAAARRAALADAEAVVEHQKQAVHGIVEAFQSCSGPAAACAERARRAIEDVRRQGRRRPHEQQKGASAAARRAAREAEKTVREMVAEVRQRSDALVRAAPESREAVAYADRVNRRAQDAAEKAERHIEKLARQREEAFRHEGKLAEEKLKREVREPREVAVALSRGRQEERRQHHLRGEALAAVQAEISRGNTWAVLTVAAALALLVGHAALRLRRRPSAAVLMPDDVLG
uniref:Uncharacterized protein n=2 Tax=Alexandrium monilatum TaxID=311494 RepID=A0A7S4S6R3_9DINO